MANQMTCALARQMDMIDYLNSLGHSPKKISGNDYWYNSPLREERHASFKVNRKQNIWYDHGIGKGGTLVDFGIIYFNCSVKEFLQKLEGSSPVNFSFHQQVADERKNEKSEEAKIKVLSTGEIRFKPLKEYLLQRAIPFHIATKFCRQVHFQIREKEYIALGIQNDAGGWELRSQFFKGSTAPKSARLISESESKTLNVFEGLFSFLSWQVLQKKNLTDLTDNRHNILLLNSLSFFEKNRNLMENYREVHLYLDRDKAGMQATSLALKWSGKYQDKSSLYQSYKDLNEYLVHEHPLKITRSHNRRV